VKGVTESQGNFVAAGWLPCRMLATVAAVQRLHRRTTSFSQWDLL